MKCNPKRCTVATCTCGFYAAPEGLNGARWIHERTLNLAEMPVHSHILPAAASISAEAIEAALGRAIDHALIHSIGFHRITG